MHINSEPFMNPFSAVDNPSPTLSKWERLRPWIICLSGSLLFFYEFIQLNIMNSLNLYLANSFGYSPTQISTLSSITFMADTCLVFVAGLLLDRISTKRIIAAAMTLCILGVMMMATSHSFVTFAIARFFIGLGCAFCFLSGFTLATRWFDPNRLSFITGVIITIGSLGGMVAQHPAMWLFSSFGWRQGLWIDAALGVVMLAWMLYIIQDSPNHEVLIKTRAMLKNHGLLKSLFTVIKNVQVWYAALFASLLNLAVFIIGALWGTRYLMVSYHMSASAASGMSSLIFLGSIVGAPLLGYIADHFSIHKIVMVGSAVGTIFIATAFVYGHPSTVVLAALFFAMGLLIGSQTLSYSHASRQAGPGFKATSSSLVSTMIVAVPSVIQPLFGYLLEYNGHENKLQPGDFQLAFTVLIALFVVAAVCALCIKTRPRVGATIIDAPFGTDNTDPTKKLVNAQ
jgi:MFS family permease